MKWTLADGDCTLKELCKRMVDSDALYAEVLLPQSEGVLSVTIMVALVPTGATPVLRELVQGYLAQVIT
jgi:hypothetical protein